MITTKNNHGETIELTFINMTDDGMYHFYGADHTFYFLEKGDFVDSEEAETEAKTEEIRNLTFTIEINGVRKKVSLFLTVCTRSALCQLDSNTTIKDFNNQLFYSSIKAKVHTKAEAKLFALAVLDKLSEITSANPLLAPFYT